MPNTGAAPPAAGSGAAAPAAATGGGAATKVATKTATKTVAAKAAPKIYDVVMGQAIAFKRLGDATLSTGNHDDDGENLIRSCAAVIMTNKATGAAGLYHYPAETIEKAGPKALLQGMVNYVHPDTCHVLYGVWAINFDKMSKLHKPSDQLHGKLMAALVGLKPNLKVISSATLGWASVARVNNQFVISSASLGCKVEHLRGEPAGATRFPGGWIFFDGEQEGAAAAAKK